MAFSLLQRFRAKPRISTSDSTTRSTTYGERLNNIWSTILDDTHRTLQNHQQRQLQRKRERQELPHLALVEYMKHCGLDKGSKVSRSIYEMYSKLNEAKHADLRSLVVQLENEFYNYRVAVRAVAGNNHFNHMDQIHTGYSNQHFDDMQWQTLFDNDVWRKYCDGIDYTKQFSLMYDMVMYLMYGVHPRVTTPTSAATLTPEDTARQNALKEELAKLRSTTKTYWPSLQVSLAATEKSLRNYHTLRIHVQPKVQRVLRQFDDCVKCVDRDPGYVPSNLNTLTFARGALKIIARYEAEVKRMNTKELYNLVTGFGASYDTSKSHQEHVMHDIDEYIKEWQQHKQVVMWERIAKQMCEKFEQSLKAIEEIQADLGVLSGQPELVKDFASIHQVLKDDLVALQQVANEAGVAAAALDRASLATKQTLAEAPCLTVDGEEFAYNVGLTLSAILEKDDVSPNEMQGSLLQALRNQSSKFEEMIENPSVCENNTYNHMQGKLADKMSEAMAHVRAKLHEEIEPVVKTIDTWYLKHLNNILCHCIDRIKASKNEVRAPSDLSWAEFPGIVTLPVSGSLKDQTLKHSQEFAQRVTELGSTLEPNPRIVLMPEMRQWTKQATSLRTTTKWTLHDAWTYLDSVYKLMQVVHLDENELLSGV